MATDSSSPLSDNLESILKPSGNYMDRILKVYEETRGKYCLWHRRSSEGHFENFGIDYECKDCMEAIKKGRCTIDVTNFDLDVYWNVRNFWLKVDIKGPDECWRWLGATRRNEKETVAYMPSPFHSAKTQSAHRVAFWLSRGYTGKYKVSHKEGCSILCCNPLHLTIKELGSEAQPTEIETINLNYGNIFARAKTDLQTESSSPE